jgi:hypothetical protein
VAGVRERTNILHLSDIFKTKCLKHQMLKEIRMLQKKSHQKAIFSKQNVVFYQKKKYGCCKIILQKSGSKMEIPYKRSMDAAKKMEAKWKFCSI